jgi:short-subunit dehydrogenase
MAVVLITGATDGLGRALAHDLAGGGHEALVHGRDPERLAATVDEIRAATGVEVASYRADLAELAQVRELADRVAADHPALDVLSTTPASGRTSPGAASARRASTGTSSGSRSTTSRGTC